MAGVTLEKVLQDREEARAMGQQLAARFGGSYQVSQRTYPGGLTRWRIRRMLKAPKRAVGGVD
jgi:hypothetical protein